LPEFKKSALCAFALSHRLGYRAKTDKHYRQKAGAIF